MPAAKQTATASRFTFAPGTLVHVLGPWQMDLQGRGVDEYTGRTMVVVEHYPSGNVDLTSEGNDFAEVGIWETRLIAD